MSDSDEAPLATWPEAQGQRKYRRWLVALPAAILIDGERLDGVVRDISPSGARIELSKTVAPEPGTHVSLELEGYGSIEAEVRHSYAGLLGLSFLHDGAGEVRLARHLIEQHPREPAPPTALSRPREAALRRLRQRARRLFGR